MLNKSNRFRLDAGHAARPSHQGRKILRQLRPQRIQLVPVSRDKTAPCAAEAAADALRAMGVLQNDGISQFFSRAGLRAH